MPIFHKIQYLFLLALCRLLHCLGFKGIYLLGGLLGRMFWFLAPTRRRYTINAVEQRLGTGREESIRIAKASFEHSFRSFLELILAQDFTLNARNTRLAPLPQGFQDLLADQRPVVAVTAHLGGWELLAGIMSETRPDRRRVIVVRNQKNRAANALIHHLRSCPGVEVVGHRNASTIVLQALREKGTAAFLVDHNTNKTEAIFLPFFEKKAAVNIGPALLALRGRATLYAIFLRRNPDATYAIHSSGPFDTCALEGSVAEKCRQIAEFYTRTVEDFIRACPEQWFWMHHRWKTKE